ncbi:putative aminoacyltransferase, E1 ubiquitin-activating enzyme [Medicago truncatula]|uniref:RING-type E3 ubiquitin transferase n=1 Tax=Medicago truncatula TaxID=3880 RepID=A0A072VWP5_MEDTR|nr:U-box domain-containing protein 3 isoform X1 [Medicago truncatula]KEH42515.1 armadillo/beta-catenin repeat protein [Medicago truncatula]RHN80024.1 putative aminoacyltransferase, E1 ubiquitin-activating enzyme [Medicago truncatula]
MHIGQTDTASVTCLINSISRFVHLVSCQTVKPMPFQKICNNMVGVLKRLKPVLDDAMDYKIPLHQNLCKVCEELDICVNEARDFIEKWGPKMSKIHSVLQSGTLLIKLQSTSLDICHMIVKSLESPPSASVLANLQHYIQELQCLKKETAMVYIEKALREQREDSEPCKENLKEIIELLKLTSTQELLNETIAVEKERLNAERQKMKGDLEEINEIVNLVRVLRDYVMKTEYFAVKSGVSFPPYFRCPLSLELMLDPVIVASGQTYERQSIKKWLDHGLTVCPKTRQRLTHTNLIPNYTVKAMIATWCEENNNNRSSNSEHNTGNAFEEQKGDNSFRSNGECNGGQNIELEKWELQSPYIHSRSESFSSSISSSDCLLAVSKDVSRVSDKYQITNVLSVEAGGTENGKNNNSNTPNSHSRVDSHPVSNSGLNELTTSSHVNKLIEDLQNESIEVKSTAAEELRLLTKHNTENRIIVGQCGAVMPLLSLLYSNGKGTQEHAVTALLNLSINEDNKPLIMEAGAIEPLIHVLKTGNDGAKENSAAALFSLSVMENGKAKIGRSGAIKALAELLASGTLRGKKDAATALYNLSIFHENKARIVQAGAVKFLVELTDPADGMADKAVALLSNLSTIAEGRLEIAREGGIPSLVEIVESGSQRGKENAASILLQLCLHSSRFCTLVLQEGAVPPLVALSQSGTPRAKEKAQQLLSHFRNQREAATTKGKS